MSDEFITIDAAGWVEQNRGRDPWQLFREVLQNALDAVEEIEAVGEVTIEFNTRKKQIRVVDNGPGYDELKHAWTVYGGNKGDDPTKRGRFSRGIKETLAGVEYAKVKTTSGTAEFFVDHDERDYSREVDADEKRENGTEVTIRNEEWSGEQFEEMRQYVDDLWVPRDVEITVDIVGGKSTEKKRVEPTETFDAYLPTVKVVDQVLQEERRHTDVECKFSPGGSGTIYEMGIPVMTDWEVPYDVNIQQRIPMAEQRNEVDRDFMRRFTPKFINKMLSEFTDEMLNEEWVTSNIDNFRLDDSVKKEYIERRFKEDGDKEVVMSYDQQSDDKVEQHGYTVVDPEDHSRTVKSVMQEQADNSKSVAHEIAKKKEEQVEMRVEQEEFVQEMMKLLEEVPDVHPENITVETWELAPGRVGDMPRADYDDTTDTLRLNVKASSWDEMTPENVGSFVHEVAHRKGHGHSLDWAKEMQRIFSELLAPRIDA